MKISKHNKEMIVLAAIVIFIILLGKVCSLSEEFLRKIIRVFLCFEIIAQFDISVVKIGKNKWAIVLKFFTKTN